MSPAGEQSRDWVVAPPPRPAVPVAGEARRFPVRRIWCVGQNYRAHAEEMGDSGREPPFFFAKPADAICLDPVVPYPPMTGNLHHEVELVVALGQGGRNLAADTALEHVYGYTVGVDLTRRDLQAAAKSAGRPWTTSKGFDCSAPLAPLRPVAACGHPTDAALRLSVNGELRQQGSTADMTWSVAEVIAELSRFFELRPGDLLFTGTPPGVGPLDPGDAVNCEIEGIARLEFRMGVA
ncbi:MAG: fumarylacetoacetate hydrolase family protein [Xanthomonadales bacterium]|nr:fumarylacetoacetate hydrolase family protein [Xanthomonadales bacterium]